MSSPAGRGGEWERIVGRPETLCASCERPIASGSEVATSLNRDAEGAFHREDRHAACFAAGEGDQDFSHWRWRKAAPVRGKAPKLDLAFLTEFFKRLADAEPTDAHALRVRWIVTLLLLRRRILREVGRDRDAEGRERLSVALEKSERVVQVTDPVLDAEGMASIHEDLARIFDLDPGATSEAKGGAPKPG